MKINNNTRNLLSISNKATKELINSKSKIELYITYYILFEY